jgi:serine acetyltransferase
MKATLRDYVLSGITISIVMLVTLGIVWLLRPWTLALLGDYHVLIDVLLTLGFYGVISAIVVRVLVRLRPIPPGTYDAGSGAFSYWMLLTVIYRMGEGALRPITPFFLQPAVEGLFGASLGRNVALGGTIDDPYRVTLGDDVVLGNASLVSGNYVSGGKLTCGAVTIGAGATIGANCVVFPNTEIGAGAVVAGGSFVMPGTRIPAGESWRGNPARKWVRPQ